MTHACWIDLRNPTKDTIDDGLHVLAHVKLNCFKKLCLCLVFIPEKIDMFLLENKCLCLVLTEEGED